jgi:hypothetical protein
MRIPKHCFIVAIAKAFCMDVFIVLGLQSVPKTSVPKLENVTAMVALTRAYTRNTHRLPPLRRTNAFRPIVLTAKGRCMVRKIMIPTTATLYYYTSQEGTRHHSTIFYYYLGQTLSHHFEHPSHGEESSLMPEFEFD